MLAPWPNCAPSWAAAPTPSVSTLATVTPLADSSRATPTAISLP